MVFGFSPYSAADPDIEYEEDCPNVFKDLVESGGDYETSFWEPIFDGEEEPEGELKELITKMIHLDPAQRITIGKAIQSEWL
jgi:hypothetical protein